VNKTNSSTTAAAAAVSDATTSATSAAAPVAATAPTSVSAVTPATNPFKELLSTFQSNPVKLVLQLFVTEEIILTPFMGQVDIIEMHETWKRYSTSEERILFIQSLHHRLIEHNLRVIAKYYDRISMKKLSLLLQLSIETLEMHLSEMSYMGALTLKHDRPAGIIVFTHPHSTEEILTNWSQDINNMLQLMESTCHLINREMMVYKV
jgi:26S proteasome regulatory subunit N5